MRCRGCDDILIGDVKNKRTGDYEDLCSLCRDPNWDNGVVYKLDSFGQYTEEPEYFVNESYQKDRPYEGGEGDIKLSISRYGVIKVENT